MLDDHVLAQAAIIFEVGWTWMRLGVVGSGALGAEDKTLKDPWEGKKPACRFLSFIAHGLDVPGMTCHILFLVLWGVPVNRLWSRGMALGSFRANAIGSGCCFRGQEFSFLFIGVVTELDL
ncbi:hypothetical protein O0I10_011545 [Lichtheimia ornata]|uniref:Uncharacterized protein n=1 Tax=Lichtheimia ornata TaxID=688661 RepID=A0AAD7XU12_9FUNG|nr:uncharacterized protein O0I10_011545 [Lichtheimia ornata]KAJ8652806.1 hypothetical protein O0I10_011545 [Lichtheimia ornata]